MIKQIALITTGGTIDKSYDELDGSLENRETLIKELIQKKLRLPHTAFSIQSVMAKDSLNMNDDDRELVVSKVEQSLNKHQPVLVTHGTDTMAETAKLAYERICDPAAPIVFTGAMSPLIVENTDAWQNLAEALLACKLLEPGVYVSFHNQVFPLPNVRKNKQRRTFESF